MFNFMDDIRKVYVHQYVRKKLFINLNYVEFEIIINYLYFLIEYIIIKISIKPSNYNIFWNQLIQNNHQELIAIFNLMFPYIDDTEGKFTLHKLINQLKDISDMKINENSTDLTKNNYLISNLKYHLYHKNLNEEEQQYNIKLFKQNFFLLLQTIDTVSNKLFTNWLNITPLSITKYEKSYLYENSFKLQPTNKLTQLFLILNYDDNEEKIPFNIPNYHYYINNDKKTDLSYFYNKLNYSTIENKNQEINSEILDYKGIALNDIFNTLYYDLFLDVVQFKWLIYQDTFDDPNKDEIYIQKFNDLIAVPSLYLNKKWSEMKNDEQLEYTIKWDIFLSKVLSNQSSRRNTYFNLLKRIIIFFEIYYDNINYVVRNYKYQKITSDSNFNIDDEDDNINDELDEKIISANDLVSRIKLIPSENMYEYLLSTIQQFMKTWYGINIIIKSDPSNYKHFAYSKKGEYLTGLDNFKFVYESYSNEILKKDHFSKHINKIIGDNSKNNINLPENIEVKYKFFYNYAKVFFLSYVENKIITRSNFKYLNNDDKILLLKFLSMSYSEALNTKQNKDETKHFNVMSFSKYYVRTYTNSPNMFNGVSVFYEPKKNDRSSIYIKNLSLIIGNVLFIFMKKVLPNIVFESHIRKGLLNEFNINPYLTDKDYLGSSYENIKKNQFDNLKKYVFSPEKIDDYLYNSFYFLTDNPYSELNEIHRNGKKSYFDLLTSEYRWFSSYSMNWISQINFFHKYINNRVIFVTGSTGQGKSTQIPKLFLYGLKMIDRKYNGKVICSQPRVVPTRDNSEQISFELGVPISEISLNYNQKINTFNPYIQYKTHIDYHLVKNHIGLMLKTVTDKILSMEIQKSPIFKEIVKPSTNSNTAEAVEFNIYKKENMYDIIMVDESHEHNINMDIILTIARDTIKYNNSLKLVIISATMTEDEPTYRRYYREIDDNLTFPYSIFNDDNNYDRFSVDRHIHISPPGETTQHKVTDNYLNFEPSDYTEAEQLGIQKVMEITSDKNLKGDILFFSLSTENIKNICKTINNNLHPDSDIICLPFYRDIPSKWIIFNDLSKKVKQITVHRTDLFNEIFPDINKITKKVAIGTYKRAIVVATNIAEASITIDSLKFVIDTGYFISVSDNPYTSETDVKNYKISEVSRMQRRGRVGRVSSGTIYYMYKKDSRKEIKSELKFCISNISNELYELMPNKYNDPLLFPISNWNELIGKITPLDFDEHPYNEIFINSNHLIDTKIYKYLILEQYTNTDKFNISLLNFMSKNRSQDTIDLTQFTNYYPPVHQKANF